MINWFNIYNVVYVEPTLKPSVVTFVPVRLVSVHGVNGRVLWPRSIDVTTVDTREMHANRLRLIALSAPQIPISMSSSLFRRRCSRQCSRRSLNEKRGSLCESGKPIQKLLTEVRTAVLYPTGVDKVAGGCTSALIAVTGRGMTRRSNKVTKLPECQKNNLKDTEARRECD